MLVGRIALKLALMFAASFTQTAQAFFDPPWITPASPVSAEVVSVNIHGGVCDFIIERPGYPLITKEGNAIRIVHYGQHYEPGSERCIDGLQTVTTSIGAFPSGSYVLTADLIYPHPVFGPTILNIGVVLFTVAAPPEPLSVPTLGSVSASVLLLVLLATAIWMLRKHPSALLVAVFACLPLGARAQQTTGQICVRPTTAPGAPTPAQIMTWINSSPRSAAPPLEAFKVKAPLGSYWLIPDRATGAFLTWLGNNPNSARKKLEDCQLTTFAIADLPAALAALQADPYVASASVSPEYQLHSVELIDVGFVPEPENPLGGETQYGLYDMNVDRAWQWAGGYALVGQIDIGLFEQHAALRQFNGNTYAGGNFIKTASKDVGLGGLKNQAQHVEHEHRSPCPSFLLGSSSPASRAAVR